MKKAAVIISLLLFAGSVLLIITAYLQATSESSNLLSPLVNKLSETKDIEKLRKDSPYSTEKVFNILLLGIDRRHKSENAFRTDIMIMLSVNPTQKKVVLTSVPRDLWVNGGRINAMYTGGGWEALRDAFEKITGLRAESYIRSDFEDLVWLVDSFGGVEIDLENGFTDYEYPHDATKTYMTVSFNQGKQLVDGKDALILARSRHGNNGEGSDFKRMARQHKILKALPDAVLSPRSLFNPFNLGKFYEMATQRMVTTLSLSDSEILWEYFPDRGVYTIESFLVDSTYLYTPPMSEYGGAWVLIPKGNDFSPIHHRIEELLGLRTPAPQPPTQDSSQTITLK